MPALNSTKLNRASFKIRPRLNASLNRIKPKLNPIQPFAHFVLSSVLPPHSRNSLIYTPFPLFRFIGSLYISFSCPYISPKQKEAYSTYSALYKEASELTSNEKISTNLLSQLKEILTSTAAANYDTYSANKNTLQNIIETIKTYLNSTPTGIDNINANSSAKAEAIFSVNGVRNAQLNKGLNIVKMSDGSVKKIMVK